MEQRHMRRGLFHTDAIPIPDSFTAILDFDDIAPAAVAGAVAARERMISRHSAARARQQMIRRQCAGS